MLSPYAWLALAVVFEVIATSALKATNGFTNLWPSVVSVVGYGIAFYCLSHCLRSMHVGVTYALWCAGGIVLVACIGWLWYKQSLDIPAILGMGLVLAGTLVISLFSKTAVH